MKGKESVVLDFGLSETQDSFLLRAIPKYLLYDIQSKKTFTFEDDLYAIGVSLKKLFQLSEEEKSYLKDCDLGGAYTDWAMGYTDMYQQLNDRVYDGFRS